MDEKLEKKGFSVDDLNKLYSEGETMDKSHFAECRTSILLYYGEHYKDKTKKFLNRNSNVLSTETKLRLQENHIQLVCNRYMANILNQAPGITIVPYNDNELADSKDAELTLAVVRDGEEHLNFDCMLEKIVNSFVVTGEVGAFLYWDKYKGKIVGYEQEVDEEGNPLFVDTLTQSLVTDPVNSMGQPNEPAKSSRPVFEGQICAEIVHPYNTIRHKAAETMAESPFICIRKMVSPEEAKKLAGGDEDKIKNIVNSKDNEFLVFDASVGDYIDNKGQVQLKYWLHRPCYDYPNGWFQIQCGDSILQEDELPFGIWPFEWTGFRTAAGTPRAKPITKDLRHPQVELNRLISQSAYNTLALGEDKIITQMGSKLQKGATWSGVREFQVNGPAPTVLPGRDGGQFEASIARQVSTIYKLADLEYEAQNAPNNAQDPFAFLFTKLSQREKFSPYAKKMETFLVNFWKIYIKLAKNYFSDDRIIKATGKREAINIAEFKAMREDGYRIKVKPMNSDIESMMGRSLQIQQILQYVGKDLPKSQIGALIRDLPFMNKDKAFNRLTLTSENIESDILAMDRGEYRPALYNDDHKEYIELLTHRTKQNDFRLLNPQIQQMYQQKIQEHQQIAAQVAADLKKLQAEYIPTSGAMVKVDVYDAKGKRITLPYDSVQWLVSTLETQGQSQDQLAQLQEQQQVEVLQTASGLAQQMVNQGMMDASGMQQPMSMPQVA